MSVRKAVILTAGYATRLLPATKSVPKCMLPIVDRPIIDYVVEEALAAGIEQIVMVTGGSARGIEDYFDREFELEQILHEAGKSALLEAVRRPANTPMAFVHQRERRGNGHAVLITRDFVGDEPFAIFFADDVIFHRTPAIRQLIDVFERFSATVLAVQRVPREQVSMYGIIQPEEIAPRTYRVQSVIEKPSADDAPSNLATVGRFVATPAVFDVLAETRPGRAGEIWLMDAFDTLARREPVYAYEYEGERFDTGQPIGLIKAVLHVALQRDDLRPELEAYLQSLRAAEPAG